MSKSLRLLDVTGCEVSPVLREPLSAQAAIELAGTLKVLADPIRLRLLSVVAGHADGEACVCDISVGIEVSQPTVSHHLKVLRKAGLLSSERRGSWVYYRVVPEVLQQLRVALGAHLEPSRGSRATLLPDGEAGGPASSATGCGPDCC